MAVGHAKDNPLRRSKTMNKMTTTAMAFAVAALFGATGCDETNAENEDANATIRCQGINTCVGTSECAGPDGENDCQGQNECAGQGWVSVDSEEDCTSEGGTVLE